MSVQSQKNRRQRHREAREKRLVLDASRDGYQAARDQFTRRYRLANEPSGYTEDGRYLLTSQLHDPPDRPEVAVALPSFMKDILMSDAERISDPMQIVRFRAVPMQADYSSNMGVTRVCWWNWEPER